MDSLKIVGGKRLSGKVEVSGAKNAALPILISSLLTADRCVYENVPKLQDIDTTMALLSSLGVECTDLLSKNRIELCSGPSPKFFAHYDVVRKMRASVLVLGPLVARLGEAKVSLPGGCAIGARPINFHLMALEKLGAEIILEEGYVIAKAKRLIGNRVVFDYPSVGATENTIMAAVLAKGETVLENCAKEPEIIDLVHTLRRMGAVISGEGTETIHIQGKDSLSGCTTRVMGDRIEAGTYLCAAMATRGKVEVIGLAPQHLDSVLNKMEECGAKITRGENSIAIDSQKRARAIDFTTLPFPGFPTDMQAQFMAVLALADGVSTISETVFENRYMHVPELLRMGADITIRGNHAIVKGKESLVGAPVMATDLRASASLIIAGLVAQGETVISRIYHLDRGYERLEQKLSGLGAVVERLK